MNSSETVLSGIRATGRLHFGNFFGAVTNFVKFQNAGHSCFYFIADLHTLTTNDEPDRLRGNLLEIAMDYLAAGLDPSRSTLYAQSSVPELIELSLYLSMFQPLGVLQNIPTFKDKVRDRPDLMTLGFLSYPVLMAADILGPRATLVPVGRDQVPNVELAIDLVRRFNSKYGPTFVEPKMLDAMVKVPGLKGGKMGKSDDGNSVSLTDTPEVIREKYLTRAVTDPQRARRSDPGDPYHGCQAIYPFHEIVTEGETDTRAIANQCLAAEIGCRDCKLALVHQLVQIIEPFQARRRELQGRQAEVMEILHEGGRTARRVVKATVEEVRDKIGIHIY